MSYHQFSNMGEEWQIEAGHLGLPDSSLLRFWLKDPFHSHISPEIRVDSPDPEHMSYDRVSQPERNDLFPVGGKVEGFYEGPPINFYLKGFNHSQSVTSEAEPL